MKRVEVKLDLTNVAPLLDVMKEASVALGSRLALSLNNAGLDAESTEQWTSDLIASQNEDIHVLLSLFDRDFFTEETVVFDEANAEAVVRASSAVKLYLYHTFLSDLDEDDFEADDVVYDVLTERQQKPFLTFMFLDTVQKVIMRHLNETLLEG
jgi:hypothetical protein